MVLLISYASVFLGLVAMAAAQDSSGDMPTTTMMPTTDSPESNFISLTERFNNDAARRERRRHFYVSELSWVCVRVCWGGGGGG